MKKLMEIIQNNNIRIIAIDGRCASGKTTFTQKLANYLNAEVIHMDDFFLRNELKTKERLSEVGGNIDYERFTSEVLEKWLNFCLSMGYSDKEIEDFLSKFQDLDNSIIQLMLQIPFGANTVDLKKPVIYLYPEKRTDISLTVEGADLTTTYPKYENGWNVTAYPDGTLIDGNGREYNYLYWEGLSNNFIDMSKGFVVSKDDYIEFLEEKLDYIGLSNKESADFISYWLPYMNEFEYCLVSFQMENYEEQVKLDFSIKPDNELRLFVAFKGLDEPIQVKEQDLSYYNNFEREGFTVVEWGGSFIE